MISPVKSDIRVDNIQYIRRSTGRLVIDDEKPYSTVDRNDLCRHRVNMFTIFKAIEGRMTVGLKAKLNSIFPHNDCHLFVISSFIVCTEYSAQLLSRKFLPRISRHSESGTIFFDYDNSSIRFTF